MEIDIFSIDKKIRDIWHKNQYKILELQEEVRELEDILDTTSSDLSDYVKKDILVKIMSLQVEIEKIVKLSENQHFYTMDFSDLVENHQHSPPKKISFMSKSKKSNESSSDMSKNYFELLKKYEIDYKELEEMTKNIKKDKKLCINCKSDSFIINVEQNLEICENCGKQEEKSYKSLSFKDIARVNLSNKYTYERRIHFKDCINQYQGKQNSTIDQKVYDDLSSQFELHGLLKGDIGTAKKTRFENVTKEHILLFLKETDHSKHYEDIVLIYHKMTGKPVDDISHLENQLMEDFDKISNLYDKKFKFTGKIDRKSFINTQYVLFQLLRRHRYPCKKEDFNMLKTLDRKSFHDDIVRELFESLNFNFMPIF
jgi:hypothetical protein